MYDLVIRLMVKMFIHKWDCASKIKKKKITAKMWVSVKN